MSDQASILVVDDEKTLRDILGKAIAKLGHRCVTACNGEEALSLAGKQAFDLVLTDLRMPKMDGLALVEWLRKEHSGLPIIIMTGYADLDSARKALRLCVSDYLVKPFESLAEVQAAIQRALQTHTARSDTGTLVKEFEARALDFDRREKQLTQTLERAKIEIGMLAERLNDSDALTSCQAGQIDKLVDNLENGILVADANGIVLSMNREIRRQLQVAGSGGVGLSVDRMSGDGTLREAIAESRERLRLDDEEAVVAQTVDSSGQECAYEVRSAPLAGRDGVSAGILTIVRPLRPGTNKHGSEAHAHNPASDGPEPPDGTDAASSGQRPGPDRAASSGQRRGPDRAASSGQRRGPDRAASSGPRSDATGRAPGLRGLAARWYS